MSCAGKGTENKPMLYISSSPPSDHCDCWNCCFNLWLYDILMPPPYYVLIPCAQDYGSFVPSSVTDMISTIIINFGLCENSSFWRYFETALPHIRYMQDMGFQSVKLTQNGFECATCLKSAQDCSCEVIRYQDEGYPDFQLMSKCQCCQRSFCGCSYRYVDYGEYEPVECQWTPFTWIAFMKVKLAEFVSWIMVLRSVAAPTVQAVPGESPHIGVFKEESYWKTAYSLDYQLPLISICV